MLPNLKILTTRSCCDKGLQSRLTLSVANHTNNCIQLISGTSISFPDNASSDSSLRFSVEAFRGGVIFILQAHWPRTAHFHPGKPLFPLYNMNHALSNQALNIYLSRTFLHHGRSLLCIGKVLFQLISLQAFSCWWKQMHAVTFSSISGLNSHSSFYGWCIKWSIIVYNLDSERA